MTTTVERGAGSAYSLEDRYRESGRTVHLTGLQALVRVLLDHSRHDRAQGRDTRTFVSGYEGSPLAGLDLELARRSGLLDEHGVHFSPGLNEEAAATAVAGSQLAAVAGGMRHDGVTGIWYGKAPGLDRATDAIRHANLMGTHHLGGVLALVGDDPGAKSSSVPCASEAALADLAIPTLYPADSGEIVEYGLHGIEMSRASGLWAGLKIVTAVADGSSTADLGAFSPIAPSLLAGGKPWRHTVTGQLLQPTLGPLERDMFGARLELARRYAALNGLNRITVHGGRDGDDRIGIVAAGKTYLDLRQALDGLGLDDAGLRRYGVRLLKLGMIWPLEPDVVRDFAAGLREIVVVEEKRSFVETAIKDLLYGTQRPPTVTGKRDADGAPLFPPHGELDPDSIALALSRRLGDLPPVEAWRARRAAPVPRGRVPRGRVDLPLLARTPYFCSGCPHSSSTKPVEGLEDSLVGAGIGCHAMVVTMDPRQVGQVAGMTQMGGEGAQWIGMAPFVEADHLIQNVGDGTFHHSGSLAVRAAVAAGVNITYRLLHNSTVAMTGGQDAVGALPVPEITRLLAAEGVRRIIVTTDEPRRYRRVRLADGVEVWPRERIAEAQRVLAAVPGVTVLIHDQECAAEKRRKRKRGLVPTPTRRVVINERICEGCGDCGRKSNCLSVQPIDTEFGRKTQIHQSSCNVDYTCLAGDCPSFMVVTGASEPVRVAVAELPADASPDPQPVFRPDRFAMRLMGVGGTGVVTVSQILATAAVISGLHVRGLDQTGLAQKGGAVVSDLKIAREPWEAAGRLAEGECDLYLGADMLVAADEKNLACSVPGRTVALVSTAQVPTGAMVTDPEISWPDPDGVVTRIGRRTRQATWLDARGLAEQLFGDDQPGNMILVGAAFQLGAIPLSAQSIEHAISVNGASVGRNIQAFRRGRQAIADPEALDRQLRPVVATSSEKPAPRFLAGIGADSGSELARLVALRASDLAGYQDEAYALDYVRFVERVRAAESGSVPGSTVLAEAVARNLYKLKAYKDEYEVARLALEPDTGDMITTRFGPGARAAWKLHPPALRALGLREKITLGPWFTPAFRILRALRRLRGTPFDVFGYAHVRRVERELIAEYETAIAGLLADLTSTTHARAVEIADLPEQVRGYEQVKLDSVKRYRERLTQLLNDERNAGRPAGSSMGR